MITVRLYNPQDYQKLLKFMKAVDKDFNPPIEEREGGIERYLNYVLNKKYRIYLLEDHKYVFLFPKIIGAVMTFKKDENRVIKYLAIAEKYRKYGHGRVMIEIAIADIRKSKEILLRTWSTNEVAISLYKKLGFKFHKIKKDKDRQGRDKSIYLKLVNENLDQTKKHLKPDSVN